MPDDATNVAVVTDSALVEAAALLERGAVTPSTLFAANSLVQAAVLHDKVILGMGGLAGVSYEGIEAVSVGLGPGIGTIPTVGAFMDRVDSEAYSKVVFWVASERPVANLSLASEVNHFSAVLDYLRVRRLIDLADKTALVEKFGIDKPFGAREAVVSDEALFHAFEEDVIAKGGSPLTPNDMLALQDLAWVAAAGYTLSRHLRISVYHSLIERPFYGNQLKQPNGPLELVHKATTELEIEGSTFDDIDIPPFLGLILSEPTFERGAFWKILLDIRHRHERFRTAIGDFRRAWAQARSVGEQRRILKEQSRAWEALIEREDYRSKQHILYTVFRGIASWGESVVDMVVEWDQYKHATNAVGGLVRLWDDLQEIVPAKDGRAVLGRHFGELPTPSHWLKIVTMVSDVNSAEALGHSAA